MAITEASIFHAWVSIVKPNFLGVLNSAIIPMHKHGVCMTVGMISTWNSTSLFQEVRGSKKDSRSKRSFSSDT